MSDDARRHNRTQGKYSEKLFYSEDKGQKISPAAKEPPEKIFHKRNSGGNQSTSNSFTSENESPLKYEESSEYSFSQLEKVKKPVEIMDSGEHILSTTENGESKILYEPFFFSEDDGQEYFDRLNDATVWHSKNIVIHGIEYPQPRLVAWFGPFPYSYSGSTLEPAEMPDTVKEIKGKIEEYLASKGIDVSFNSVLLNLYRDGKDSVSWHSDDELTMGISPTIASISLGETRKFEMRPKKRHFDEESPSNVTKYFVHLVHGSLIVMTGCMQEDWQHRVPKEYHDKDRRINLTFRTVFPKDVVPGFSSVKDIKKETSFEYKPFNSSPHEYQLNDEHFPPLKNDTNSSHSDVTSSMLEKNVDSTSKKDISKEKCKNTVSKTGKKLNIANTNDNGLVSHDVNHDHENNFNTKISPTVCQNIAADSSNVNNTQDNKMDQKNALGRFHNNKVKLSSSESSENETEDEEYPKNCKVSNDDSFIIDSQENNFNAEELRGQSGDDPRTCYNKDPIVQHNKVKKKLHKEASRKLNKKAREKRDNDTTKKCHAEDPEIQHDEDQKIRHCENPRKWYKKDPELCQNEDPELWQNEDSELLHDEDRELQQNNRYSRIVKAQNYYAMKREKLYKGDSKKWHKKDLERNRGSKPYHDDPRMKDNEDPEFWQNKNQKIWHNKNRRIEQKENPRIWQNENSRMTRHSEAKEKLHNDYLDFTHLVKPPYRKSHFTTQKSWCDDTEYEWDYKTQDKDCINRGMKPPYRKMPFTTQKSWCDETPDEWDYKTRDKDCVNHGMKPPYRKMPFTTQKSWCDETPDEWDYKTRDKDWKWHSETSKSWSDETKWDNKARVKKDWKWHSKTQWGDGVQDDENSEIWDNEATDKHNEVPNENRNQNKDACKREYTRKSHYSDVNSHKRFGKTPKSWHKTPKKWNNEVEDNCHNEDLEKTHNQAQGNKDWKWHSKTHKSCRNEIPEKRDNEVQDKWHEEDSEMWLPDEVPDIQHDVKKNRHTQAQDKEGWEWHSETSKSYSNETEEKWDDEVQDKLYEDSQICHNEVLDEQYDEVPKNEHNQNKDASKEEYSRKSCCTEVNSHKNVSQKNIDNRLETCHYEASLSGNATKKNNLGKREQPTKCLNVDAKEFIPVNISYRELELENLLDLETHSMPDSHLQDFAYTLRDKISDRLCEFRRFQKEELELLCDLTDGSQTDRNQKLIISRMCKIVTNALKESQLHTRRSFDGNSRQPENVNYFNRSRRFKNQARNVNHRY